MITKTLETIVTAALVGQLDVGPGNDLSQTIRDAKFDLALWYSSTSPLKILGDDLVFRLSEDSAGPALSIAAIIEDDDGTQSTLMGFGSTLREAIVDLSSAAVGYVMADYRKLLADEDFAGVEMPNVVLPTPSDDLIAAMRESELMEAVRIQENIARFLQKTTNLDIDPDEVYVDYSVDGMGGEWVVSYTPAYSEDISDMIAAADQNLVAAAMELVRNVHTALGEGTIQGAPID